MKKIALPLLLFVATLNAQTFTGTGEAAISNITPEQAKLKAHEQAFLDILQQATGIEISSQQLVVNAQMASYHILQTHRARVVNSRCDYRIEPNPLTQIAICTGEVQAFGKQGPSVQTALLPLGNKNQCQFSASEFNAAESTEPMFKSGERFCLLIQPQQDVHVGVFALYQDGDAIKISRVFPDDDKAALAIRAGHIPALVPLSAQPLPQQSIGHEAFIILASREPLHMPSLLANSVGLNASQTAQHSVAMEQFDRALGRLDLNKLSISVLPYVVTRK